MAYRTFKEWQARGRYVVAGEKAMGKLNDGTALFGKEQTKKVKKKHFYSELVLGRIQSGVNDEEALWKFVEESDKTPEKGTLVSTVRWREVK